MKQSEAFWSFCLLIMSRVLFLLCLSAQRRECAGIIQQYPSDACCILFPRWKTGRSRKIEDLLAVTRTFHEFSSCEANNASLGIVSMETQNISELWFSTPPCNALHVGCDCPALGEDSRCLRMHISLYISARGHEEAWFFEYVWYFLIIFCKLFSWTHGRYLMLVQPTGQAYEDSLFSSFSESSWSGSLDYQRSRRKEQKEPLLYSTSLSECLFFDGITMDHISIIGHRWP